MTAMTSLVEGELAAVRGELARIDAKCATLTGLAGAALAFLVTQAGRGPLPVTVLLAAAGVALMAAAVLLLRILRPRLGPVGFCQYASMTSDDVRRVLLQEAVDARRHWAGQLIVLSRIAKTKNRRIQRAVDLLVVGLALIAAALIAGVIA